MAASIHSTTLARRVNGVADGLFGQSGPGEGGQCGKNLKLQLSFKKFLAESRHTQNLLL